MVTGEAAEGVSGMNRSNAYIPAMLLDNFGGIDIIFTLSLSFSHSHVYTVAQQCLSEAYGIDLGDASQRAKYEVKPTLQVFTSLNLLQHIIAKSPASISYNSTLCYCIGNLC